MILILQVFRLIKFYKYYESTLNNIVPVIIYKHIDIDNNKMEKVTSANTLYMERIDKKLDIILNILQKKQTNSVPLTTVDTNFLNYFPLKELEALKDLEEKLKTDNEFKSKLVKILNMLILLLILFLSN